MRGLSSTRGSANDSASHFTFGRSSTNVRDRLMKMPTDTGSTWIGPIVSRWRGDRLEDRALALGSGREVLVERHRRRALVRLALATELTPAVGADPGGHATSVRPPSAAGQRLHDRDLVRRRRPAVSRSRIASWFTKIFMCGRSRDLLVDHAEPDAREPAVEIGEDRRDRRPVALDHRLLVGVGPQRRRDAHVHGDPSAVARARRPRPSRSPAGARRSAPTTRPRRCWPRPHRWWCRSTRRPGRRRRRSWPGASP